MRNLFSNNWNIGHTLYQKYPYSVRNNFMLKWYMNKFSAAFLSKYRVGNRAFEILSKLVRYQWLKKEKFHITKEANRHFSFLNSSSNEVPQSQKRNPSAKHSQLARFGDSPSKQGRALCTSVLVWFVWNFGFRVYKYWIYLKNTCPYEIQNNQMP